jgi:hypothetical protein
MPPWIAWAWMKPRPRSRSSTNRGSACSAGSGLRRAFGPVSVPRHPGQSRIAVIAAVDVGGTAWRPRPWRSLPRAKVATGSSRRKRAGNPSLARERRSRLVEDRGRRETCQQADVDPPAQPTDREAPVTGRCARTALRRAPRPEAGSRPPLLRPARPAISHRMPRTTTALVNEQLEARVRRGRAMVIDGTEGRQWKCRLKSRLTWPGNF